MSYNADYKMDENFLKVVLQRKHIVSDEWSKDFF